MTTKIDENQLIML